MALLISYTRAPPASRSVQRARRLGPIVRDQGTGPATCAEMLSATLENEADPTLEIEATGSLVARACLTDLWRWVGQAVVMAERRVLTDAMWARLEPLLPDRTPRRGGRWSDQRKVVEAIIWRFRTGSPWRDLPAGFPAWQTVWWRFDRWSKDGTLDRVLAALQGQAHAEGDLEWVVSVDSTIARAHQHAAGAPRAVRGGSTELHGSLA